MASSTVALLTLIVLLLVSFLPKYIIAQLRPNCVSQFALANQACALVPISVASIDLNHTRVHVTFDDDDDYDNGDDDGDEESEHPRRGEHGNGRGQRRGNGRGQRRGNGHGHRQRHRHGHGHGGGHREEPRANRDCCRWVEDVDESCVCTTLLRLPIFLLRLKHSYSITVGNTCSRTFNCHGV